MHPFIERQLWSVFIGFVAVACTGEIGDATLGGIGFGPTAGTGGTLNPDPAPPIGRPGAMDPGATGVGGAGNGGGAVPGIDGGLPPPTGLGGSNGGNNPSDGGAATAFCDLQQMLRGRCVNCHSNPPVGGAPMSLVTYANLVAPAPSNPSRTVADVALARMQDGARPMPPAPLPRATASEVSLLSNWLAAGSPSACLSPPPTGDAGGATGPTGDAGGATGISVIPLVCTSGQHWTGGNEGSASMHPGGTCVSCHSGGEEEAPKFTIAGTVYPTVREPTDCNGANGAGMQVVITDAAGRVLTLPVNAVGNFSTTAAVTLPFHAKVVRAGVERAMTAAQSSGDCNGCHTPSGANGAPGRIVVP